MIDINSKIMADMKNGSSNMDQAVTTAIEYVRLGYKKVVSASEISLNGRVLTEDEKKLLIDRLNDELEYQEIDFKVLPGNLMCCDAKMMAYFKNDLVSSINHSRYILLELPMTMEYKDLNRYIYDIQIKGFVPIIAHPERCKYIQENPDYLLSLKERDCLIQLDIHSVTKSKGSRVYKCAKELLQRHIVDVVATETENAYEAESVRDGIKILHKIIDSDYFDLIMRLHPQLIIENERIDRISVLDKKKGGLLSRIFGKRR
ncbi:tyrosine-protein phosphatase [uncultured Finegoldia sp.]|uniref:tyrosine-protein phosphatase n=1 Tax=uncultured Finegoldia sp. TaxID=328009 RepID=UPI00262DB989|nr:CpsB/CapC family capsule biosynthesis tyrosine phosphatase [uncultured Finegoldia sp.]